MTQPGRRPRRERPYFSTHAFPWQKLAGFLLVVSSCLVFAGVAWQQSQPGETSDERAINSMGRSVSTTVDQKSALFLRPTTGFPIALSLLVVGSFFLGRSTRTSEASPVRETEKDDDARLEEGQVLAKLIDQQLSLSRAERTAVATEFAATISHEIRNPLAGIQMSLDNMITEMPEHPFAERLRMINSETVRVADLLGQAVKAARPESELPEKLDLPGLIEDLFRLMRIQIRPNVRLEYEIEPGLVCSLPPDRLRHCLAGFLINSAQAIGDGNGLVRLQIDREAELFRFVVQDDGPGFPDAILRGGSRPFTTSDAGASGFGLAMARRFVREMGGNLELSNTSSDAGPLGSRVTILLPSADHHG